MPMIPPRDDLVVPAYEQTPFAVAEDGTVSSVSPNPASAVSADAGARHQSGHTPGPWVVKNCGIDSIVRSTENHVCRASHANARLIAAAPDLLDALRRLLNSTDEILLTDDIAHDVAHAAIAKAEGR